MSYYGYQRNNHPDDIAAGARGKLNQMAFCERIRLIKDVFPLGSRDRDELIMALIITTPATTKGAQNVPNNHDSRE